MSKQTRTIIEHFSDLEDPRIERKKLHSLQNIIAISVSAIICGAKTFEEIELFGNERMLWLTKYLSLPNGIPSHDTFGRVFSLLDPKKFQELFISWVETIRLPKKGEVVAIDGKTARRSFDTKADQSAIHVVSAWASENRLVLGQIKVDDKSNEITAIPELIDMLMVKDCTVTIDAMGCQKSIAGKIVGNGAEYVLAVKDNQPKLHEQIRSYFDEAAANGFDSTLHHDMHCTSTKGHGREEYREYHVLHDISWLEQADQWPSLMAVGVACSVRQSKKKEMNEIRYYILSSKMSAKDFGNAVRCHWGVENDLHWTLDVSFREDECRIRKENAPANMNVVRHIAVNLLKQEKSTKVGIVPKQLKAALSTEYLERVLGIA